MDQGQGKILSLVNTRVEDAKRPICCTRENIISVPDAAIWVLDPIGVSDQYTVPRQQICLGLASEQRLIK